MRALEWSRLFSPKYPPWEIALRAAFAYVSVQVLLRLVGRKELARYSTFDIVLLFLISTAMRQTIVGTDESITSGLVGLATLVALDALFAWASRRNGAARQVLEGPIRHLVHDGQPNDDELRKAKMDRDSLRAELRRHGRTTLSDVRDAYLERSGQVSFIFRGESRA